MCTRIVAAKWRAVLLLLMAVVPGVLAAAPSWIPTGDMRAPRTGHTATLLPSGKVLVAGGDAGNTAELYDPASRTWSDAGKLTTPAGSHAAMLLKNGKVLLVSTGQGWSGGGQAEIYDPAANAWTATGSTITSRAQATLVLLDDGRVLASGGGNYAVPGYYLASAELYDPASGKWTQTGSMATPRVSHTATKLRDGRILVAAGSDDVDDGSFLASAELYDPTSGTWSATGSLTTGRETHQATLLGNGDVLVCGGDGFTPSGGVELHTTLNSCEVFHPDSGMWTFTGPTLSGGGEFTLTGLAGGSALAAGGFTASAPFWLSASGGAIAAEYQPGSGTWTAHANLNTARFEHTATLLANGDVLVAGGSTGTVGSHTLLASAEIYTAGQVADVDYSNVWYDRTRSGHGIDFHRVTRDAVNGDVYLLIFYTFDGYGGPVWYAAQGRLIGNRFVADSNPVGGTLSRYKHDFAVGYRSLIDPVFSGDISLNFNDAALAPACSGGRAGALALAVMHWRIEADSGDWCMEPIVDAGQHGAPDFNGTWYAGSNDSGWGLTIVDVDRSASTQLASLLYLFDTCSGEPYWVMGNGTLAQSGPTTLPLLLATNGYCPSCAAPAGGLKFWTAGLPISFNLTQATNEAGRPSGVNTVDIVSPGGDGGICTFGRAGAPITLISEPPGN